MSVNTVNQKTIIYATIQKGIGTQVDGAFTNYVIAREESLHHIPDEVSYQSAAYYRTISMCTSWRF